MHDSMKKAKAKVEKMHPVFAEQRKVTRKKGKEEELTLAEISASIFQLSYFSIQ